MTATNWHFHTLGRKYPLVAGYFIKYLFDTTGDGDINPHELKR